MKKKMSGKLVKAITVGLCEVGRFFVLFLELGGIDFIEGKGREGKGREGNWSGLKEHICFL